MVPKSDGKPPAGPVDYAKRRSSPGPGSLELNAEARTWLESIEEPVRPRGLAAAFPRIVNLMAELWSTPRRMNRYFEQLLTDKRGTRKGFPLGILMELTTLKEYYESRVFPHAGEDVWSSAENEKGRKF